GRISLGGSGANRTITLTPQPNRNGATTIQLRVSDGLASTTGNLAVTVASLNDPPTAGAFVGANRALIFSGNGYVSAAAVGGLAIGNSAHTIEAWIRPAQLAAGQRSWALLLGQETIGGEHWLLHAAENNKVVLQFGAWNGTQVEGPTLDVGVWQHVAATWESSNNTYAVYVNGVEVGRTPSAGTAPVDIQHSRLMLGWSPFGNNGGEENFRGRMDEVRVWNRALPLDEINRNRNYPLSGTESDLMLY